MTKSAERNHPKSTGVIPNATFCPVFHHLKSHITVIYIRHLDSVNRHCIANIYFPLLVNVTSCKNAGFS